MMHTCACAFQGQWRFPEALRAASRAATLFRDANDQVGEAIALETAAHASVSGGPTEVHGVDESRLFKEISGPPGGQAQMDAVRFGQTSILYEKKPWQPISKFHPILSKRGNLLNEVADVAAMPRRVANMNDQSGRPLWTPKKFGWGRPSSR